MTLVLLKTFFSCLELFTGLICSFTIFRLPIKYYVRKIAIVAIITSIISAYTFTYIPDFAFLINLSCQVIILSLIFRLPFFYSLLINFVFYLLGSILELCIIFVGTHFHFFEPNQANSPSILISIFIVITILLAALAWILERKKIGFMFIARYFTIRQSVKGYNFALSSVLISGIAILNISIMLLHKNSTIHLWLIAFLTILFLAGIYIAYKENKKQLDEKHERLKNR